jgi:hypothetical protein
VIDKVEQDGDVIKAYISETFCCAVNPLAHLVSILTLFVPFGEHYGKSLQVLTGQPYRNGVPGRQQRCVLYLLPGNQLI